MDTMVAPTHQLYPSGGALYCNLNMPFDVLRQKVRDDQADVYCYIVATIRQKDGCFFQTGSGPNFQGDLITLCTCKHLMRSFLEAQDWRGKWIAGFTGVEAGQGRNHLVYLMKVAYAFRSHYALWVSDAISPITKCAKAADHDRFGDLYQPLHRGFCDEFAYQSYHPPVANHVHCEGSAWQRDIGYQSRWGHRASLLVGDSDDSFLWDRPGPYLPYRLHRGQRKGQVGDLLRQLQALDAMEPR